MGESVFLKTDIHVHIINGYMSLEERRNANKLLGISKCVLLSMPLASSEMAPGYKHITPEEACQESKKNPENVAWLCNVNPLDEANLYETLCHYKEMGASGVGEFSTRLLMDSPVMDNLFSICEDLGLPFLFHMAPEDSSKYYGVVDDPRLPRLESMLKKHPKLIFIGHSQPFWYEMAKTDERDPNKRNSFPFGRITEEGRVAQLMREYPNLYCDLSANSGGNALMRDPEYAVKFMTEFKGRLMFGTDWVGGPFNYGLSGWLDMMLVNGAIEKDVYENICANNAEKVFWSKR